MQIPLQVTVIVPCFLEEKKRQSLKNYKLLEDYDNKNIFDIEDYIKRKDKVKMNRNTVITRL